MDRSANPDAIRAWDGTDGAYWARHDELFDVTMRGYRRSFMAAARLSPGESVLDIGCGNGQTSCDAAAVVGASEHRSEVRVRSGASAGPPQSGAAAVVGASEHRSEVRVRSGASAGPPQSGAAAVVGAGTVVGVDVSAAMLARARSRAAALGLENVSFVQADAQITPFGRGAFDVVISRTGAMFFADPAAAFTNIGAALRPGGRLVLLVWQSAPRNEWFTEFARALGLGSPNPPPGVPGPFSLSDPAGVVNLLNATGFGAVACESVEEPMNFGSSVESAMGFVRGMGYVSSNLAGMDAATRAAADSRLDATITAHATAGGVVFGSAAWLVTAERRAS